MKILDCTNIFLKSSYLDILKEFNPNIKGFSVGNGDQFSEGAHLNVAAAGAMAQYVHFTTSSEAC